MANVTEHLVRINRMLRHLLLRTQLCTALSRPSSFFALSFQREAVSEAASVASEGAPERTTLTGENCPTENTRRFRLDSPASAKELVRSLRHEQKRLLLSALHECSSLAKDSASDAAVDAERLFRRADRRYPRGLLDREEFIKALRAHKLREEQERLYRERLPVPFPQLWNLGVATGVPYIAFGFLDNFIMITAGESIEHVFGLALGLSIMAAAAWGNLVSDVAGVCFAENIEAAGRKLLGLHAPKLSRYQQSMIPVRVARTLGAVLGVSVGCVLGMLPLLWF